MSPSALLVHGGGLDGRAWEPVRAALGAAWVTSAPDRPRVGDLLDVGPPPVPDERVPDELASDEPLVLVGASTGAGLVLEAALARPHRVRRLVLVAPVVPDGPVSLDAGWTGDLADAARAGPAAFADHLLADPWATAGVDDAGRARLRPVLEADAGQVPAAARSAPPGPLWSRLPELAVPTVVLVGALDDPANRAMGAVVAAAVPQGSSHLVPGVGPTLEVAQPSAVAQAVRGEIGPWPDLRPLVRREAGAVVAAVAADDPARPSLVPGWSVGAVAAHMAVTFRRFTDLLARSRRGDLRPPFPADGLADENARALAAFRGDPLDALAAEVHRFCAAAGDPHEVMAHQRGPIAVGLQLGLALSELALHHHDVAPARRPPPPVVDAMLPTWRQVLTPNVPLSGWDDVLAASGRG